LDYTEGQQGSIQS